MSAAFDIGPLSWVKSEIDSSLDRARSALQAYGGSVETRGELANCRAHLHQAAGAVQIVGLEGVSRFFEEVEALAAELEAGRARNEAVVTEALQRAIAAIGAYLADLIDGAPDQPLKLFPAYCALCEARGAPRKPICSIPTCRSRRRRAKGRRCAFRGRRSTATFADRARASSAAC
jgi:chemosensory pili system protein ChpA (sensor histidine kinase/response regulator)